MYAVRKANIDDARALQDLNHKLFVDHIKYDKLYNANYPYEKKGEQYFKRYLTNRNCVVLVATENDKIIAYLSATVKHESSYIDNLKIAEISSFFVSEDYRSQGIGSRLVDEFKKWANKKQAKRLIVNADSSNLRGVSFYRKKGFSDCHVDLKIDLE